jgi:hypothetical protein
MNKSLDIQSNPKQSKPKLQIVISFDHSLKGLRDLKCMV